VWCDLYDVYDVYAVHDVHDVHDAMFMMMCDVSLCARRV
jgi:hypothetical protein